MANREVVICLPVRTAIGTYGGTLKDMPAVDLGAAVVRATLDRAKLRPGEVGTVVMGNVIQAGNKMNPARQAAINGGVPVEVPAMTVNRVCGSGAQAIASAAQEIMLGLIDSAVAGGMENMGRAPYLMNSGRWGYRMGDAPDLQFDADGRAQRCLLRPTLRLAYRGSRYLPSDHPGRPGPLGRALAEAVLSGPMAGKFAAEIAPVEVFSRKGPVKFDKDEHNRPETTLESLSKLQAGLPKGRYHHGRKRAGPQYRGSGYGGGRPSLGRKKGLHRWLALPRTVSARSSRACSVLVPYLQLSRP